jgi:hypothetical protein
MPLNTDPDAIPDDQYYAEYAAHAAAVGDDGLHTSAEAWLKSQGVATDGEDR